jgi:hypothetical protein
MKTFARYAWPVPLTGLIMYGIYRFLDTAVRPLYWWSIAGCLGFVAGMQYLAYRQDRKYKIFLEQQRARIADMGSKSDAGTKDPRWL